MSDDERGALVDLHSVFELDYPQQREYALLTEQGRRAQHERVHGSGDGYVPGRSFPCPGALRRCEEGSEIVQCDVCLFEVSIPAKPPVSVSSEEW